MKKILCFALLLSCIQVHAITRTAIVNNGTWSAPATWSGNAVPGINDTAIIPLGIRVVANLGTAFMAPWNNPKTIFVRGTFEMTGNDPVFSNPVTIEVYSGATFYDHTDFAEYYLTPVSRLIVRLGAICQHTGSFTSSNILSTNSASVPTNYTIPAPVTPPFTLTINPGTITYTSSVPLPLELSRFQALQQGEAVKLNWQTADEKQTAFFDIERNTGGTAFESIGRIAATGTGAHQYETTDARPATGDNLYRLKMTDVDGNFTYSQVLKVFFGAGKNNIVVYPNPAYDELHIQRACVQTIQVYNALGRLVLTQEIVKDNGVLDIRNLKDGMYYFSVDGQQMKFVKRK